MDDNSEALKAGIRDERHHMHGGTTPKAVRAVQKHVHEEDGLVRKYFYVWTHCQFKLTIVRTNCQLSNFQFKLSVVKFPVRIDNYQNVRELLFDYIDFFLKTSRLSLNLGRSTKLLSVRITIFPNLIRYWPIKVLYCNCFIITE